MWKAIERASHLAAVGAFILGVIWFLYTISSSGSATQLQGSVTWGSIMKVWLPPMIIALTFCCAAVLQVIASRMRRGAASEAKPSTSQALTAQHNEPSVEIVSPFDSEEVGLYETVRGRVFPSDRFLQVFVFAGDNKWYAQRHVAVSGTKWSVRCQFGNPDAPSAGVYKIAAVLDSHLNEGIWYADLPNGVRSNVITVHRPEITIEQKLSSALKDAEGATGTIEALRGDLDKARGDSRAWERKYHELDKALTGKKQQLKEVERERDRYKAEMERQTSLKEDQYQSFLISRRELAEFKTEADAQTQNYDVTFKGMKEELATIKREVEIERERADSEAHDKINYRAWFNDAETKLADLKWLEDRMKDQGDALENWVRIKRANAVILHLTTAQRMVIIAFQVQNESVFDVTLDLKNIKGCLHYKNRPLRDPIRLKTINPTEEFEPKAYKEIILEQPLLQSEAETILAGREGHDPNGIFWLGNLYIPILVENIPQKIKPDQKLAIYSEIEHMHVDDFRITDNA